MDDSAEAREGIVDDSLYPKALEVAEQALLAERRARAGVSSAAPTIGLALSGGGIRSATFGLGLLQALATRGRLRQLDFLSTVSGGGYIGSFLGALISRGVTPKHVGTGCRSGIDLAEHVLSRPSPVLKWLRDNGRYLAPNGAGDVLAAYADALRSWITIQLLLGLALVSIMATLVLLQPRVSTLAITVAPVLGLGTIPATASYMALAAALASSTPSLLLAHLLITDWKHMIADMCLWALVITGAVLAISEKWPLFVAVTLVAGPTLSVFLCYDRGRDYHGSFSRDKGLRRTTAVLATVLLLSAVAVTIAGVYLAGGALESIRDLDRLFVVVVVASLIGSVLAGGRFFATRLAPLSGTRLRLMVGGAVAAVWLAFLGTMASWLAHRYFAGGPDAVSAATIYRYAALVLVVVIVGRNLRLLNSATWYPIFKARLSRAYLGASNTKRVPWDGTEVAAVTRPLEGDDEAFDAYSPHTQGGPLHILNLTLNETKSGRSNVEQHDRKGLSFAVGPAGLSVSSTYHSLWPQPNRTTESGADATKSGADARKPEADATKPEGIATEPWFNPLKAPLALLPGLAPEAKPRAIRPCSSLPTYHALFAKHPHQEHTVECLTLAGWTAASGAAVSSGLGAQTGVVTSLLVSLANLRLGYWWDSGVSPWQRPFIADNYVLRFLTDVFPVYSHLAQEMTARFYGPNRRRWYLTDGGHFENTGAFELIRRKVRFIIVTDCGMDPEYTFTDIANLARKVRQDLNAELRMLTEDELSWLLPEGPLRHLFGGFDEFHRATSTDGKGLGGSRHGAHAMLAWVLHGDAAKGSPPVETVVASASSVVMFVKPSVNGDEPLDILTYREGNNSFPQEGTADQFFDEAQWESYRRLGEHIGECLFHQGFSPYLKAMDAGSHEAMMQDG